MIAPGCHRCGVMCLFSNAVLDSSLLYLIGYDSWPDRSAIQGVASGMGFGNAFHEL